MTDPRQILNKQLAKTIDYQFTNWDILNEAMTHRSYIADFSTKPKNYERLEFLGDRVLGLLVTEMLYELFPEASEGELSRRLTRLVCGPTCTEVGRELGLDKAIILGVTLEKKRASLQASIVADACESLIGALYQEGGFDIARRFVRHFWHTKACETLNAERDAKTALQEWVQGQGYNLPVYEIIARSGPDHRPSFSVKVSVDELDASAIGEAGSKKVAEQRAAEILLEQFKSAQEKPEDKV